MTPTATVVRPSSRRAWARTCVVVPHVQDCVWLLFFPVACLSDLSTHCPPAQVPQALCAAVGLAGNAHRAVHRGRVRVGHVLPERHRPGISPGLGLEVAVSSSVARHCRHLPCPGLSTVRTCGCWSVMCGPYVQLGYTSAFFRLDNVSVLTFGADKPNVLAVFVDATESQVGGLYHCRARVQVGLSLACCGVCVCVRECEEHSPSQHRRWRVPLCGLACALCRWLRCVQCTGWWYEGGGVFRHSTLTSSWSNAHVVPHGLHFVPTISAPFNYRVPATDGVTAAAAKIEVRAGWHHMCQQTMHYPPSSFAGYHPRPLPAHTTHASTPTPYPSHSHPHLPTPQSPPTTRACTAHAMQVMCCPGCGCLSSIVCGCVHLYAGLRGHPVRPRGRYAPDVGHLSCPQTH